jgi:hypothetical protein
MLKEMVEEIKKNEEKATKLHEIINLIGGDCCLDNVVTRVEGIINDNPLNPTLIKAQLEDLQYNVNEAESEYSDKYSDIESAVSNLEYISSELDSLYHAQVCTEKLLQSIEDAEMDKETEEEVAVKKTAVKKTTTEQ